MPCGEFESAFPTVEWPQNYALHRTAIGIRQIKMNVTELRRESKRVIFGCVQWRSVLDTCAKEGSEFAAYFSEY
jgi:hypothetical protein